MGKEGPGKGWTPQIYDGGKKQETFIGPEIARRRAETAAASNVPRESPQHAPAKAHVESAEEKREEWKTAYEAVMGLQGVRTCVHEAAAHDAVNQLHRQVMDGELSPREAQKAAQEIVRQYRPSGSNE